MASLTLAPYEPPRWQIDTPDRADRLDVFPLLPGRQFLIQKSPIFRTKIAEAVSGRERRAQFWSAPRWLFKVNHEFLRQSPPTQDEIGRLYEFFCAHFAQALPFYFFDQTDHAVVNEKVGVGDGYTVAFQLRRSIRQPSRWTEPVYATSGAPQVFVDDVQVDATPTPNGVITLPTPPAEGAVITWSGHFMFLCRFDQDQIDFAQDFSDIWSLADLSFRSLKPNAPSLVMPGLNYSLPTNSMKWLFANAF